MLLGGDASNMSRSIGQIDLAKHEAILDAAIELLVERGVEASLEDIARRAGVAKQTIYNHYGSKNDVVRALAARRAASIAAPLAGLDAAQHPERTLAAYGVALLQALLAARSIGFMRFAIGSAATSPELARAIYHSGIRTSRTSLADYLVVEASAGRLSIPNPSQAAEMYAGMVIGSLQSALLLNARTDISHEEIEATACEAAHRFMRAFAPD